MIDVLNKVVFVKEAANELRESVDWYELSEEGLSLKFINTPTGVILLIVYMINIILIQIL